MSQGTALEHHSGRHLSKKLHAQIIIPGRPFSLQSQAPDWLSFGAFRMLRPRVTSVGELAPTPQVIALSAAVSNM